MDTDHSNKFRPGTHRVCAKEMVLQGLSHGVTSLLPQPYELMIKVDKFSAQIGNMHLVDILMPFHSLVTPNCEYHLIFAAKF